MKPVLDVAVPVVTFLVMTIVGLDLTRADFERVRSRPGVLVAGLLAAQVLGMLVLPVLAGMTLRSRAPAFVARHETAFGRIAFGSLALLLGFILVNEWDRFVTNLGVTAAA